MQHYATAATQYNFGYAASSMNPATKPVMDFMVVQGMKNQLATNITNFQLRVKGMPGSPTRQAMLGLLDQARKEITAAQTFLDNATAQGLWTRHLENQTLAKYNSANDKYKAAAGMAATTGGPPAPGVTITTPTPTEPTLVPTATVPVSAAPALLGGGTLALLVLAGVVWAATR